MINTDKMREKYAQIILARRGAKPEGFGDIVELCDASDEMSGMVEDCKTKLRKLVEAAEWRDECVPVHKEKWETYLFYKRLDPDAKEQVTRIVRTAWIEISREEAQAEFDYMAALNAAKDEL